MVNAVQVKAYLKPLLAQYDDLELIGRLLVIKPVRHVLRAVIVDRQSWREAITPKWFCYHVFGPHPCYYLSWGDRLWERVWRTTDSDISEALGAEIERVALPKLRPITTLTDFMDFIPTTKSWHLVDISPDYQILFGVAMGDLETARSVCREKLSRLPVPEPKDAPSTKAEYEGTRKLSALLEKNDIKGLVDTLHAWEAANVKALKIDHLWERTPFPIEEKYGLV